MTASAQIKVQVSFDQEQFLPNESIMAKVKVSNSSGQNLVFGVDAEWLSITVESPKFGIINEGKPLEQVGEFSLPSAHSATRKVDLIKSIDMSRVGRYTIIAEVYIAQWGGVYTSAAKEFIISPGTTLKELTFGIPTETGKGSPEFRKYQLIQANHLKDNRLYLRITDLGEEHTYKIFPLGPQLSFSNPEAQLDTWNNLHVLFQIGARSFQSLTVSPDGILMTRQTHEYSGDSRPILTVREDGAVRVKGGIRRPAGSDLPPPDFNAPKETVERVSAPTAETAAGLRPGEAAKPADAKRSKKK
jgi:hypothetical protein